MFWSRAITYSTEKSLLFETLGCPGVRLCRRRADGRLLTDGDLRKADGQFWHARWWLWSPIPGVQILPHFGQARVRAEDDWEAAPSFCLLRLSFAALCVSASSLYIFKSFKRESIEAD